MSAPRATHPWRPVRGILTVLGAVLALALAAPATASASTEAFHERGSGPSVQPARTLLPRQASSSLGAGPVKPVPPKPAVAKNVTTTPLPTKPKASAAAAQAAYTLTLTTSAYNLWPTTYATLTATASSNVGPTPYYIGIYDDQAKTSVAVCGTGSSCSVAVKEDYPAQHYYRAYVASWSSTAPPPNIQATSGRAMVTWKSITLWLGTDQSTVTPGAPVTLTARTSVDVGPTPFYTYLIDETGQLLTRCAFGTACAISTSQASAGTHRFSALVAGYATSVPLPTVQSTVAPSFVTWTTSGYRVSLNQDPNAYTLTASSNVNVGPTPYYITIYALNPGGAASGQVHSQLLGYTQLGFCGSGTTCTVNLFTSPGDHYYVAFISGSQNSMPPPAIQASSGTINVPFFRIDSTP